MRVLVVIAVLVGAALMILFALADLARDLSRHSFLAPPDLDSSEDLDVEVDEFADAAAPSVSPRIPRTLRDNMPDRSNALDDLHSAL